MNEWTNAKQQDSHKGVDYHYVSTAKAHTTFEEAKYVETRMCAREGRYAPNNRCRPEVSAYGRSDGIHNDIGRVQVMKNLCQDRSVEIYTILWL